MSYSSNIDTREWCGLSMLSFQIERCCKCAHPSSSHIADVCPSGRVPEGGRPEADHLVAQDTLLPSGVITGSGPNTRERTTGLVNNYVCSNPGTLRVQPAPLIHSVAFVLAGENKPRYYRVRPGAVSVADRLRR